MKEKGLAKPKQTSNQAKRRKRAFFIEIMGLEFKILINIGHENDKEFH